MNDPIAEKLDDKWALPFLREPNVDKVRAWLREQPENEIRLYLSAFEEDLDERHRIRAALIREELQRRATPPPDRVSQIIASARSNWFIATIIVLALAVAGAAALKENLCKIAPDLCGDSPRKIKDIFQGGSG